MGRQHGPRTAKRKHSDKTLLSQAFQDKEGAALQLAWTELQMTWVSIEPLTAKAKFPVLNKRSHFTTLRQKFAALCVELSDKTCVSDSQLVASIMDALTTVKEQVSLADDLQHLLGKFEEKLTTFLEKVELHIDIGQCLDKKEEKRIKGRGKRRRRD